MRKHLQHTGTLTICALAARAAGRDAERFAASAPYADLDARWGQNLIKGPGFARMVFASLPRRVAP